MRARTFTQTLVLAGAVLAFAGCSDRGEKTPGTPKQAGPVPRVSVDMKESRVPFWGMAHASARVENTLKCPIALLSVELRTADDAVFGQGGGETTAAKATKDGAVLEGTLFIDDPGAQARAKFPDRWQWEGKDKLVHFPVLRPGQAFSITGGFRVTHETGDRVLAVVRFVELADDLALLKKTTRSLASIPPPAGGTFGKGWVPTRRMTVTFKRAAELAKFPHRRDLWSTTGKAALLPAHYPQALLGPGYDVLAKKARTARAEQTFEVDGPPLSLSKAREQAGVAKGPCTYFPARSAWVIEGEGETHIVTAAGKETHKGRLVRLVNALTHREPVELTLFSQAAKKDPGGHVAFLSGKGLRAESKLQKGNTYRGTVRVAAADLPQVLKALSERGLRVDGLRVR